MYSVVFNVDMDKYVDCGREMWLVGINFSFHNLSICSLCQAVMWQWNEWDV